MSSVFSRFKKKENDPSGGADEYEKVQLRPKSLDTSQKKKSNLLAPTISSSSKATSLSASKKTRPVGDWVSERKNGQSTYKVAQKNNNLYKPGLTKSTPNLAENRFRSAEKKTASLQRGKGLIVNTAIPRAGVR
ncbi:uncharacterized protein [Atheta coriaria]|uniref:uncharacterized protein isoform X2 n=1 Tax=Dalotia coriaria TaxID=877792 RepID=UPI0031F36081